MTGKSGLEAEEPIVSSHISECVGILTMNHPRKANCLGQEMIRGILKGFEDFEKAKVRVVVLRAYPGAKVWSAGHDIRELPVDGQDPLQWNIPFEQLLYRVRTLPMPVIAMIEGSVWGGACDLAMTCDLLVGSPTATFAITPAKIGLPYNTAGLTHFLGVLPLHIIKEMLFSANPLSSDDAHRFGLLNRLVDLDLLEETTLQIARDVASRAPLVVQLLKTELRKLTVGHALNPDEFEEIQYLRSVAYRSEDFREGIAAFLEKRSPEFKGK